MRKLFFVFIVMALATPLFSQQLSVMSFNVRYDNKGDGENQWGNRKEAVVECINHYRPDVIGTQEGLSHQVEYLEEQLSDYTRIGVAREDGKEDGEYCAVFFRKDRFELIKSDNSWLSTTPQTPSFGWDAACKRIITSVILKDLKNGKTLHFINTHFDHAGKQAREQSPKYVLDRVDKAGDDAVVFVGDLNATHSDKPIQILLESGKLFDSFQSAKKRKGADYTFHNFGKKEAPTGIEVIDYIMYNKSFTIKNYETVDSKFSDKIVSDHFPVFAILKYNK